MLSEKSQPRFEIDRLRVRRMPASARSAFETSRLVSGSLCALGLQGLIRCKGWMLSLSRNCHPESQLELEKGSAE